MRLVLRVALAVVLATAPAWAEMPEPGGSYGDALRWYGQAAEAGDVRAQFLLAVKYELGIDVDQDLSKAAAWYGKAAEQGHVEAQFKLAIMLEQGRGLDQDPAAAVGWYRAAGESGFAAAQYNMGVALLNGSGVERDVLEAFAWISVAADQGLGAAVTLRDRLVGALGQERLAEANERTDALRARLMAN